MKVFWPLGVLKCECICNPAWITLDMEV